MGGKPKTNTPADMRLVANKQKYGSVANRDAAKQRAGQKPATTPPKKGSN